MLDKDISAQLQQYMGMLRRPFTLTATETHVKAAKDKRKTHNSKLLP